MVNGYFESIKPYLQDGTRNLNSDLFFQLCSNIDCALIPDISFRVRYHILGAITTTKNKVVDTENLL